MESSLSFTTTLDRVPTCWTIATVVSIDSPYKRETRVRTRTNIISWTFLRRPRRYNVRSPLSLGDTHTTIVFAICHLPFAASGREVGLLLFKRIKHVLLFCCRLFPYDPLQFPQFPRSDQLVRCVHTFSSNWVQTIDVQIERSFRSPAHRRRNVFRTFLEKQFYCCIYLEKI